MKHAFTLLMVTVAASPALAHSGAHLHPHAEGSSAVPLVAGVVLISTAAVLTLRHIAGKARK
ncbi:hypothetical protein [Vannielia sp.]|uniref:hypothetical protein n=1 Tax=Vannielia sp. TaxID=2813045 RepID=UPI00262B4EBB|nr:hypothetical protein [Vannielia sp.]MDF1872191.1 hypothetical protein [Vannielia sp.]